MCVCVCRGWATWRIVTWCIETWRPGTSWWKLPTTSRSQTSAWPSCWPLTRRSTTPTAGRCVLFQTPHKGLLWGSDWCTFAAVVGSTHPAAGLSWTQRRGCWSGAHGFSISALCRFPSSGWPWSPSSSGHTRIRVTCGATVSQSTTLWLLGVVSHICPSTGRCSSVLVKAGTSRTSSHEMTVRVWLTLDTVDKVLYIFSKLNWLIKFRLIKLRLIGFNLITGSITADVLHIVMTEDRLHKKWMSSWHLSKTKCCNRHHSNNNNNSVFLARIARTQLQYKQICHDKFLCVILHNISFVKYQVIVQKSLFLKVS